MSFFLIGVSALAVDYGLLTNQHRGLQEAADSAALAGASQLTTTSPQPSDYTKARTQAYIYLRSGMLPSSASSVASVSNMLSGCGHADFSSDVDNCHLPSPYNNYVISIDSPAHGVIPNVTSETNTVSVSVTETVATVLASILPQSSAAPGATAVAQYNPAAYAAFSLWSAGQVTVGNDLQIVEGDVFIASGGMSIQSSGQAGFCAEQGPAGAGNIIFGKGTLPASIPTISINQTRSACQNASNGAVLAMGNYSVSTTTVKPPTFTPPPGIPTCSGFPGQSPAPANPCGDASAVNLCKNHTVNSTPVVPSNCFNPGAYRNITGIANNLNPGIYHIEGDQDPSSGSYLQGQVSFTSNTLNANYIDVRDSCWAAPNGSGSFTAPCPDGFAFSPVAPTDPQCGGSGSALGTPNFSLAASATGGSLDPSGTGTTYYVRVSATDAYGETATTEKSVVVLSPVLKAGSIAVTITPVVGATGYQVYGPSTSSNTELNQATALTAPTVTQSLSALATGTTPYPRFDTSSCHTGFHNIPKNQYENNGVTFVLDGQVSFNAGNGNVVLLSPYCSVLPNNDQPPATNESCFPATQVGDPPGPYANSGANINDGGFSVYGPTSGTLSVTNTNTKVGVTGTLDVPSMTIAIGQNAFWEVIPGQVIALTCTVQSGNHFNPAILSSHTIGARMAPIVRLVE
jgi:Flp pilus assembly protein TadG